VEVRGLREEGRGKLRYVCLCWSPWRREEGQTLVGSQRLT
jgi:hypothetical protein